MRVPKREDQSLFILLFNCHTSIILDLLGLSTLFLSFFQMEMEGFEPSSSQFRHAGLPRIDYQIHPQQINQQNCQEPRSHREY